MVFRLVWRMRFSAEKVFAILVQTSGYRKRGPKLNALAAAKGKGPFVAVLWVAKAYLAMAERVRQEKEHVHALLERLAPSQLSALRGLLEAMLEPIDRSIAAAQLEEQEIAPKTAKELDRAKGSIDEGRGIVHEDILREFGVTPHA